MKKKILKHAAIALALALATPAAIPYNMPAEIHAAAAPKFNVTSKNININKKYTLTISNKPANVKSYSWSSTNKKVADVNYKGEVTAIKKGTATIKCKITYSNKKTKTLSCKITVKVPATAVDISNALDENGVHTITMGETYDFNRKLTPTNSTYKTYWTIKDTTIAEVDKSGVVTPKKTGTTILTATAASGATTKASSKITDQVVLKIVDKSASVTTVGLIGSNQIEVKFSEAMNASTLVDPTTKKLKDAVVISATENSNKVKAADPGEMTGELSEDKKTLVITASNMFNGTYDVKLTSEILTESGIALTEYLKKLELVDNIEPYFVQSVTDDSGLVITLKFNEPLDISNIDVVDAGPKTLDSTTIGILKNKSNYLLSEDKKSLKIDLSMIPTQDRNTKNFSVQFAGIKDMAGNSPKNLFMVVNFYTDTSPKAQARIVSITRSGYDTLTVQYDRAIKTAGYLSVNGTDLTSKTIDVDDNKKVHYTLSGSLASLTGTVTVSIGYWEGYNVSSSDNSANNMQSRSVSFNFDKSAPVVTSTKLETKTENKDTTHTLTIVYNKSIVIAKNSGSLSTRIKTVNDDIISNLNLAYTAKVKDKTVTLTLNNSQLTESGEYFVTLPAGFVTDSFNNPSDARTLSITKNENNSSSLPGPTSVVQSETNPSVVMLNFSNKLDLATATNISNYSIKGAVISKAEVIQNTEKGAVVELTFAQGKIPYTTNYELVINGVKGHSGNYTAIKDFKMYISLKENTPPRIESGKIKSYATIELIFSENIQGTPSFEIYEYGKVISDEQSNTYSIDGNKLTIWFNGNTSASSPALTVAATNKNKLTDNQGNVYVNTSIVVR